MSDQHQQHQRTFPVARELRGRETVAEELVWTALRGRRLVGCKFRRQHQVGRFVVDFCCLERRLAVEVDGEIHNRQQERDAERDAVLAASGLRVLRVSNADVQRDFHGVLATIRAALQEPLPE